MRDGLCAVLFVALLAGCGEGDSAPPAVGTLERDRLELIAEASEPLVARPVEEGQYVEAGQLILALDPARLNAQTTQAAGARDRAAARLAELRRGPRAERIDQARARLKGAEGRLATAESDRERAQQLFDRGVNSRGRLDQQDALWDEALAARDAAKATLDELLEGTTAEELAQAAAALAETEAALADSRLRLERLNVRAPTAGWIDALPYRLGERPPPGGVVAVLLEGQAPYARVYVPEAIRVHVTPGTMARVRVDGLEGELVGRVRSVSSDPAFTPYYALTERDRGRLVYVAKVDLTGPEAGTLPSGVPVEVRFESHEVARE